MIPALEGHSLRECKALNIWQIDCATDGEMIAHMLRPDMGVLFLGNFLS